MITNDDKVKQPTTQTQSYHYIKHGVKSLCKKAMDVLNLFDFPLPPVALDIPTIPMLNGSQAPCFAWSPHAPIFAVSMMDGSVAIGNASGYDLSSILPHSGGAFDVTQQQQQSQKPRGRTTPFRPFLQSTPSLRQPKPATPAKPKLSHTPFSPFGDPKSFQSPIRQKDPLTSAEKAFQPLSAIKPKPNVLFSPTLVSYQDTTPFAEEDLDEPHTTEPPSSSASLSSVNQPKQPHEWLITTLSSPRQYDIVNLVFSPVDGGILAVATKHQGVFIWFFRSQLNKASGSGSGDDDDDDDDTIQSACGWVIHIPPPSQRDVDVYNEVVDVAWTSDGKELIISYKDTGYTELWNVLYTMLPSTQAFVYYFNDAGHSRDASTTTTESHLHQAFPPLDRAGTPTTTSTTPTTTSITEDTRKSPLERFTDLLTTIFTPPTMFSQTPPQALRTITLPHAVLKLYPSSSPLMLVSYTGSDGFSMVHLHDLSYESYQTWNNQPISNAVWNANNSVVLLTTYYSSILMQLSVDHCTPPPSAIVAPDTPLAITFDPSRSAHSPASSVSSTGYMVPAVDPLSLPSQLKQCIPAIIRDALNLGGALSLRYIDLFTIQSSVLLNIAEEDVYGSHPHSHTSHTAPSLHQQTAGTLPFSRSYISNIAWDTTSSRLSLITSPLPQGIPAPLNTIDQSREAKHNNLSPLTDPSPTKTLSASPSAVLLFDTHTLSPRRYTTLTIIGAVSLPSSVSRVKSIRPPNKRKREHGIDGGHDDLVSPLPAADASAPTSQSTTLDASYSLASPSLYPSIPDSLSHLSSTTTPAASSSSGTRPWPVSSSFHPCFDKGSLLSVLWSNGVCTFAPLYHTKRTARTGFAGIDQSDVPAY